MLLSSTRSRAEIIRPEKSGLRMDAYNRGQKHYEVRDQTKGKGDIGGQVGRRV